MNLHGNNPASTSTHRESAKVAESQASIALLDPGKARSAPVNRGRFRGRTGAAVLDLEEHRAARRPRRVIGECTVRDGMVVVQLPARLTPDQADAWGDHLKMLARAAREGVE